jgi:hypothetical protein
MPRGGCAADHSLFRQGRVRKGAGEFGCPDPKVVAMLAEIFMMQLEAAARALQETAPSSNTRFVAFNPHAQITFKESRGRLAEAASEKSSLRAALNMR